ncbi:MAG: 3'-5' exoribonuclease [Caldilineaceae bacterium]|nr:3'-5' exoribonuclease [Caldilineaceae bacterium]
MAERTFVALDLETTGLDSGRDAIIEIGAVRFQGETILDRFATFVHPQRPIPLRIQQITGIDDRAVSGAPTIDQVASELLAFVDGTVDAVVAHSAPFDIGFLGRAGIHFHRPTLDTHELATILLPGLSSYSLGELCRSLRIDLPHAHRALDDAEAAARLLMQIQARIRALPRSILRMMVDCGGDSTWAPLLLFREALDLAQIEPVWPGTEGGIVHPLPPDDRPQSYPTSAVTEATLSDFFAADGPLARQMGDGYEMRKGQVEMAHTVLSALNDGGHHLIEAGTGTGKSLAYLLPAALWAMTHNQRVVIATDTITLQEQLLEKEIPQILAIVAELYPGQSPLRPPLRTALLKGRSHYLCLHRLHTWLNGRNLSHLDLRLLARVLVWLPQTQNGDLDELAIYDAQERAIWQQITSDPLTCTLERCGTATTTPTSMSWLLPSGAPQDFYWNARQRGGEAHLLVVNHALLMADLQSGGRLLPAYEHLIVDEAHRLENAATEQFTYRIDNLQIEALLKRLPLPAEARDRLAPYPDCHRLARQVVGGVRTMLPAMRTFIESLLRVILRQPEIQEQTGQIQRLDLDKLRQQPRWSQVEIEWDTISAGLRRLGRMLEKLAADLQSERGPTAAVGWQDDPHGSVLNHLQWGQSRLAEMDSQLETLISGSSGQRRETISWLELNTKTNDLTFCVAPVHVSDLLEKQLLRPRRTAILTGATLRTDEGFDFIQERLGCWNASTRAIESPFDYQSQVLLYLPSDVPMIDRSGYQSAIERAIIEAARGAEGRTLVLFTSHAHLRATADAVRAPLDQTGVAVLEHGFSSRGRLLRDFRTGRRSVLLGTGTFWEGIDMPGEMLSCLVIVRLPFAVPTDPLVAARSRAYDNPFLEYTVPDAVLRFRQGFGRLIRRADDRGVVVLLDSRIWQRDYGSAFLDALPACTIRHAPLMNLSETIAQWLNNKPWSLPSGYDGGLGIGGWGSGAGDRGPGIGD